MKADELRAMAPEELAKKLDETYRELFNLLFRLGTRQLENTAELRTVRKDIARLKTVQKSRRIEDAAVISEKSTE